MGDEEEDPERSWYISFIFYKHNEFSYNLLQFFDTDVIGIPAQHVKNGNSILFRQFLVKRLDEGLKLTLSQHPNLFRVELAYQLLRAELVFQHQTFDVSEKSVLSLTQLKLFGLEKAHQTFQIDDIIL